MKISEAWAIFRNISNDGTPDLEKGRAIQIVMDAATHNSITKTDMLRVIRWLWNMVFVETTGKDEENAITVDAPNGRAEWINIVAIEGGNCYGFCSACAAEQHAQNPTALKAFHKYCRWCGAKMDK